jgi:hypothetical protein
MQKWRKLNKHTDTECSAELTDIFKNALLLLEGGQREQSTPRERDDVRPFQNLFRKRIGGLCSMLMSNEEHVHGLYIHQT